MAWEVKERHLGDKISGANIFDTDGLIVAIIPANPGQRTHQEAVKIAQDIVYCHNTYGAR